MKRSILVLQIIISFSVVSSSTEDWAIKVHGGLEVANQVAKEHGVRNLGEVLPNSDIYHFERVHRRRHKREENLFEELMKSSPWSEKQIELTRVKRQITTHFPINRNIFNDVRPPIQSGHKKSICSMNTYETETKQSRRCVFPFVYKGKLYSKCTNDHSVNGKEWCATEVTPKGEVVNGQWGDCNPSSLLCHPVVDEPSFPFQDVYRDFFGLIPIRSGNPQSLFVEEPPRPVEVVERNLSAYKSKWNDRFWPEMWYLNRGGDHLDMNVEEAWEGGYSGKGVVVTILDDGVEWDHPDLIDNYDENASADLNDRDGDPYPRYDIINSNKHGTRCAGQIAAAANNSYCSVGIAFNAKVGGIRILDGRIFDSLEAQALSYNRDYIDIYSASWGPDDNGATVDGPGVLAKQALEDGIKFGRKGKGSIFVWASGNGGKKSDDCNCDGYSTSIFTLSVSSTSENGFIPWYSESCASSLATTYSSGASNRRLREKKIVTTDLHGSCTKSHTGTSASSPMAAALIALTLEANPNMTWRDVQHIVVLTARGSAGSYLKSDDWSVNGAGREFSHSYGFGLMDADAMVKLAANWTNIPEQMICHSSEVIYENGLVGEQDSEIESKTNASLCSEEIKSLEHIHLFIDLDSTSRRGDLSVSLTSPSGTTSRLLNFRPFDDERVGFASFNNWPMMSVHFWGENITNKDLDEWTLKVINRGNGVASLKRWKLRFYGSNSAL
uniref:furin n=1 Tax=Lepeophtheirus salmonis TaxID=72036 RepID=A0A0K2T2H0_LEPSM